MLHQNYSVSVLFQKREPLLVQPQIHKAELPTPADGWLLL